MPSSAARRAYWGGPSLSDQDQHARRARLVIRLCPLPKEAHRFFWRFLSSESSRWLGWLACVESLKNTSNSAVAAWPGQPN